MVTGRPRRPTALTAEQVRTRIRKALVAADAPPGCDPRRMRAVPRAAIRGLPEWVLRVGGLRDDTMVCVWCEPRRAPAGTFPSQVTLDLPAGRYVIDALDAAAGTWFGRESAAGGPLVAGLPYAGGPVLLVVRPLPA